MSIFISIGSNCSTRSHIQKYNNVASQETLFFDWLIVDIESVIELFKHYNSFDTFFSQSHIVKVGYHTFKSHIKFTNVPTCEFLHDLPMKYTPTEFDELIEKYRRRFARILDYIRSTSHLYFVFKGDLTSTQVLEFSNTIKTINPQSNFTLVYIVKHDAPPVIEPHFIQISAAPYKIKDFKDSNITWKELNYDWSACFNAILELTRPITT
jgi:hypothetical protein